MYEYKNIMSKQLEQREFVQIDFNQLNSLIKTSLNFNFHKLHSIHYTYILVQLE